MDNVTEFIDGDGNNDSGSDSNNMRPKLDVGNDHHVRPWYFQVDKLLLALEVPPVYMAELWSEETKLALTITDELMTSDAEWIPHMPFDVAYDAGKACAKAYITARDELETK